MDLLKLIDAHLFVTAAWEWMKMKHQILTSITVLTVKKPTANPPVSIFSSYCE